MAFFYLYALFLRRGVSSTARRKTKAKSHTGRNVSILALIIVVGIIAVALSGAFTPQQTFSVLIHVYDQSKAPTPESVTDLDQLVKNVNVTVSGPRNFSKILTEGISPEAENLPPGTYQITTARTGYQQVPATFNYLVGSNCERRDFAGNCHVWVGMQPTI